MKTNILLSLILTLTLSSCKAPKFYEQVSKFENEAGVNFNPYKLVLNEFEKMHGTSDHIIFQYSPKPDWNSKEFSGVIYDVDQDEYYYFENTEKNPRMIILKSEYPFPQDNYYKFVIDNYMKGKIDYLQRLGETAQLSGITTTNVIYDIDLNSDKVERFTFKDFLFMNGKPTTEL